MMCGVVFQFQILKSLKCCMILIPNFFYFFLDDEGSGLFPKLWSQKLITGKFLQNSEGYINDFITQ